MEDELLEPDAASNTTILLRYHGWFSNRERFSSTGAAIAKDDSTRATIEVEKVRMIIDLMNHRSTLTEEKKL